jgi:hypothetical protein
VPFLERHDARRPRVLSGPILGSLLGVLALTWAAGCSEDLESSGTCPILCPEQDVPIQDTVLLAAVTLDTTLSRYPALGSESRIPIIHSGDSVEARAVIRYDVVTTTITPIISGQTPPAIPISSVDSARVLLRFEDTLSIRTTPITLEVYDVDTAAADTATAAVDALFRGDRLLGAATFEPADVKDSAFVFLDNARILAKLQAGGRVRLGVRAVSDETVFLRLEASGSGREAVLGYRGFADTAVRSLTFSPNSATPVEPETVRSELADYGIVHSGAGSAAADELLVGGLPGRRAYLRFDIPRRLIDSTTIVRATLVLVQRPSTALFSGQSTSVYAQTVLAGAEVTDPGKAVLILAPLTGTGLDSLNLDPRASAARSLEVANTVSYWRVRPDSVLPRALVLRSPTEGLIPRELRFYSVEASADLRPRLSISYIPRVNFGLP